MKNLKQFNKKGQAEIISTILLILIAISAAGIILVFATNFVRDKLAESDCFEISDKIEVTNNLDYTCYDSTNNVLQVQVGIKDTEEISAFKIEVGGASTTSYDIKPSSTISGITMYDGTSTLEIPKANEERTYKISLPTRPTKIKVYPINQKGKLCDSINTYTNIELC